MNRNQESRTGHFAPIRPGSAQSRSSQADGPGTGSVPGTPASLSVNYLPTKFAPVVGIKRRKGGDVHVPKRGGGRDAFRAGEARMPQANDEDYDGVQSGWFGKNGRRAKPKMKWNRFKLILFVANLLVRISASIPARSALTSLNSCVCIR